MGPCISEFESLVLEVSVVSSKTLEGHTSDLFPSDSSSSAPESRPETLGTS